MYYYFQIHIIFLVFLICEDQIIGLTNINVNNQNLIHQKCDSKEIIVLFSLQSLTTCKSRIDFVINWIIVFVFHYNPKFLEWIHMYIHGYSNSSKTYLRTSKKRIWLLRFVMGIVLWNTWVRAKVNHSPCYLRSEGEVFLKCESIETNALNVNISSKSTSVPKKVIHGKVKNFKIVQEEKW